MSVILTLLGIVVAAAGVAALGFGIPINEFTLGTTLMTTGSTALTGGLILIGLGAVVAELARVTDALKGRAEARTAERGTETSEPAVAVAPSMVPVAPGMAAGPTPPMGPGARPSPRGRPELPAREARSPGSASKPAQATAPSAVDVSASAIERLRATIPRTDRPGAEPSVVAASEEVPLSPNEVMPQQMSPSGGEAASFTPKIAAEDRASGAVEALRASRLDFLFRSKPAARPASQPQNGDPAWSAESRTTTTAEIEPQQSPVEHVHASPAQAASEPDRPVEPAPAVDAPRSATILKSGVVDGMAYTLYADGSIEATLPQGTVRFGSIAELRAHIESNS